MNSRAAGPSRQLGIAELAKKVSWEGGVIEALEYGIGSEEIADPELATVWRRMEELYSDLRPAVRQAQRILSTSR